MASSNGVVALRDTGTATPTTVWTSQVLNAQYSTPVFDAARNLLYVGDSTNGEVVALDATTGSRFWAYATGQPVMASPALDSSGNLYVGNNSGDLFAFSWRHSANLTNAVVFDYETNASTYSIRVQVKDEHNASVEGNFTVTLTDDLADNPAKVIFVKAGAAGTNDGTTWTNAYVDLQDALSAANAGDEINVATGTYKPTADGNRSLSFTLVNGVSLVGGYAGLVGNNERNMSAYETILSGDIGTLSDDSDNSYHVVKAVDCNASTLLTGFTIRDGKAYGSGTEEKKGGGIYVQRGAPDLRYLKLLYNKAEQGAGIYLNDSDADFTSSRIQGNEAIRGGGMMIRGPSTITLHSLQFVENMASQIGGGIDGKRITAEKLRFTRNSAGKGGAISVEDSYLYLKLCLFRDNNATQLGGAIKTYNSHFTISNSVLYGNRADKGGAIHIHTLGAHGSSYLLEHLTLANNYAQTTGSAFYRQLGAGTAQLKNSIIWGNVSTGKTILTDDPTKFNVSHTILQGSGGSSAWAENNATDGGNNLDIDPGFLTPGNPLGPDGSLGTADDGLQLPSSSPGINAGAATSSLFDLRENNRTRGSAPDL